MTWLLQDQVSAGDPLAGLDRPRGDPAGLQDLGARYGSGGATLTSTAQQLVRLVGHVLGQSWSGTAASACAAACVRSAQAVLLAARAYESASAALASHAARLSTAQAEFDAARQLADEALTEERAHHAAAGALVPGPSFGDLLWHSPLRTPARMRAEQAVADAATSARQATAALQELTAPLTVPAPARNEGHWYDQATGFATGVWDGVAEPVAMGAGLVGLNGDAGENWAALGSGLRHAVTNPGDFAKALVGWEDLSQGNYGHWAGELAPSVVAAFFTGGAAAGLKGADAAAAAARAGAAASTAAGVARGLPGALKDVRVLVAETPDGLRLPTGLDTTSLQKLLSEASRAQGAEPRDAGAPGGGAADLPLVTLDPAQLEAKFKHAVDFGVADPRGAAGFAAYGKAVDGFVRDSTTIRVLGSYRGKPAILNYNRDSRLVVVQGPDGSFKTGWRMSEDQLRNVISKGSLGGG